MKNEAEWLARAGWIRRPKFRQTNTSAAWECKALTTGNLIQVKDGRLVLVGHVNESRGECDCCTQFRPSDVIAYLVVVEGL